MRGAGPSGALPAVPPDEQDPETIRQILHSARTIAVVGLSANVLRPSHFVGFYLQRHGYRVIPVNPAYDEVLGEQCYPTLRDIPEPVDVVDCFRRAEDIPPLAEEAIAIGANTAQAAVAGLRTDTVSACRGRGGACADAAGRGKEDFVSFRHIEFPGTGADMDLHGRGSGWLFRRRVEREGGACG